MRIRICCCFFCVILVNCIGVTGTAQKACVQEQSTESKTLSSGEHSQICAGWKRLTFNRVSLCVPVEFEIQNVPRSPELFAFESEELRFSVDINSDAWRPTVERKNKTYMETVRQNHRLRYWSWTLEDYDGWRYVAGLNVWQEDEKKYLMSAFLFSKTKRGSELAEKIFESVCQEPR